MSTLPREANTSLIDGRNYCRQSVIASRARMTGESQIAEIHLRCKIVIFVCRKCSVLKEKCVYAINKIIKTLYLGCCLKHFNVHFSSYYKHSFSQSFQLAVARILWTSSQNLCSLLTTYLFVQLVSSSAVAEIAAQCCISRIVKR